MTLLWIESVLNDCFDEDGVLHGLGGTETYAKFTIFLCVGVVLIEVVPDAFEVEVLFVLGVIGTILCIWGVFGWFEELWDSLSICMRLKDGDSIKTTGFRFLGVTEVAEALDCRARGSGLSSGSTCFIFGGGVIGRIIPE